MRRRLVLIVEDDLDARRLFRSALTFEGFAVRETGDGFSALQELTQPPLPDCVVLDLGLPIVSGRLVREEMVATAELRGIPVVVVTGSDEGLDLLIASDVLRKPVTPDELVQAVRRCLEV